MMPSGNRFPTTSWSLVLAAALPEDQRSAFERLCNLYWPPVYAFIRSQSGDSESARDLTQAFFTRLLEKHDLRPAEPGKGRFRSFLVASVKHFLANERDRERTKRRGGGWDCIPLDLDDPRVAEGKGATDGRSPEKIFETRWAMLIIDHALDAVKQHYDRTGQRRLFDQIEVFLLGNRGDHRYETVAEELGISEAAVKMAVHRLRRRFGEALRSEISLTVSESGDVEDELRYLLFVLST